MWILKAVLRVFTGTSKCVYCGEDGIWGREGQAVCDAHKAQVAACGFRRSVPVRARR